MKIYNFIIRYRLSLSLVGLVIGVILNIFSTSFWPVFPLYLIGTIGVVSHFLIGPLRLIQEPMEKGDIESVEAIIKSIRFPNLLIKPVRSTYFTLLGNVSMMKKDFDTAEKHLKKSSKLGSPMAEAEGANKLQLGILAMQKNNLKDAERYLKSAIQLGIPDNENQAMAYLGLCQIYTQRQQFRVAKDYFRKAKNCKPKTKQITDQIKEIDKYLARMPG